MQVAERSARISVNQSSGVAIMGSFSLMHWIVVLAIILILFGAGKLPRVMGDFAKGIKAFKAGMKEEDEAETPPPAQVPPPGAAVSSASAGVADRPREHV
jgi:sec-independent protein translocase protein TatA